MKLQFATGSSVLALCGALTLSGCLTASLIKALPDQSLGAFEAGLPAVVGEAKARPGANPAGKIKMMDQLIVAPVVYQWAPEGHGGRAFAPLWVKGETSGSVQWLTDEIEKYIIDGLKQRGFDVVSTASLKNAGMDLSKLGFEPASIGGRAYDGRSIGGYPYIGRKLKKWGEKDFAAVHNEYPAIKTVVFVDISAVWLYKGHGRLNDEAIVNYNVATVPKVRVCTGGQCVEAKLAMENPLMPVLFAPADKADNEGHRTANNKEAVKLAAKFNADVVLSFIENITYKAK